MSDEPNEEQPADKDDASGAPEGMSASTKKLLLIGLLGLLFLFGSLQAWAHFRMSGWAEDLKSRIETFKAERPRTRKVLFDKPVEGNAVDRYWLAQYILGGFPQHVETPTIPEEFDFEPNDPEAKGFDLQALHQMLEVVEGKEKTLSHDARTVIERYGPLTKLVREGVRSGTCDWETPIEFGPWTPVHNLNAVRRLAYLMIWQAHEAEADEAVELGLEIVAFGRDLARHPTSISVLIGTLVKELGHKYLLQALREKKVSPVGLRRIISVLGQLEPIDLLRVYKGEGLAGEVFMADLWKSGAVGPDLPDDWPGRESLGPTHHLRLAWNVTLSTQWEDFRTLQAQIMKMAKTSLPETLEMLPEFKEAWHRAGFMAEILTKSHLSGRGRETVARDRCRDQAIRLLAAAKLLETRNESVDSKAIEGILNGPIPNDPYLEDEKLAVWQRDGTWVAGSTTQKEMDPTDANATRIHSLMEK